MRLQRMMLALQPCDIDIQYVPERDIPVADALSRENLPDMIPDISHAAVNVIGCVAVSPDRYSEIQRKPADELNELYHMVKKGWPDNRCDTPHAVRWYCAVRDELSIDDGLIPKGSRLVMPPSTCQDVTEDSCCSSGNGQKQTESQTVLALA